jgi:hypothetical protein
MQPVNLASEVEHSYGALGYSVLRNSLSGVERITVLMLRNGEGVLLASVFAPAETLTEVIF